MCLWQIYGFNVEKGNKEILFPKSTADNWQQLRKQEKKKRKERIGKKRRDKGRKKTKSKGEIQILLKYFI